MIENNLSCVVVWYKPDMSSVSNIINYFNFFKKIYIIDNSDCDNRKLVEKIGSKAIEYIPNFNNLGISKALNIGCYAAYKEGFEWCMTMDQDSSWTNENLNDFLIQSHKILNNKVVSFAPNHTNSIKSNIGYMADRLKTTKQSDYIYQTKVMTSGNLINLNIWNQIGQFNEKLFIDEVDHEFCYRLLSRGYKICEFQCIYMIHTLGNAKHTFLPRPCKHSGVRLYYIFRNMLYIRKNFYFYYKKEKYFRYMFFSFIQKLIEFKFHDINFMIKGIKAFKNNQYGPFRQFL